MTDVLTPEQRSRCMAAIRGKNTKPELVVRRILTAMGRRYRLHSKKLPGRPDIVMSRIRKAIFVHGCFWHRHDCPYGRVSPKTNSDFWEKKFAGNTERDKKAYSGLREIGWKFLVVWECEIKKPDLLLRKLTKFLGKKKP